MLILLNPNNEQWKTDATEIINQNSKTTPLFLVKCFGWDSPCTLSDWDHPHSEGRREDLHKESSVPL